MVIKMKIVFMGTPDFAASALEALIQAGHQITAVVTQPDKAKGRSKELQMSPVKVCALKHDILVFQPTKIKEKESVEELKRFPADVFVVAAFGQIVSKEILDIPRYGCLNIHASLLPRYRGASPIQHVLINGENKTGITIMQMDEGIDTGDMLYGEELTIEKKDNFETLHDKLMVLGGKTITNALSLLEKGELTPISQDDELSSYAPIIRKSMGNISFAKSAWEIECLIRGMTPWPSAYTQYKGKQLKIWEAESDTTNMHGKEPGTIVEICKDKIGVSTKKGIIWIKSLQLEGKKRMDAKDFLLGVKMQVGEVLGKV